MPSILLFALFTVGCLLVGCSEDDVPVVTQPVTSYPYRSIHVLDSGQYVLARSVNTHPVDPVQHETYVYREKVLGEPFIDYNGNGVYDRGVDGFIIGVGPDNQDLNHNGTYDGPDSYWTPGVPFDDLDGDGEPRDDGYPNYAFWTPGTPYCDYNGNGKWDADLAYWYDMVECIAGDSAHGRWYRLYRVGEAYHFKSDSGVDYFLPGGSTIAYSPEYIRDLMLVTDSSICWLDFDGAIAIFDSGTIRPETTVVQTVTFQSDNWQPHATRITTFGQQLTVDGQTYSDLIKVRLENFLFSDPGLTTHYRLTYREFYFSPTMGLMAILGKSESDGDVFELYFVERYASLPLPMKR